MSSETPTVLPDKYPLLPRAWQRLRSFRLPKLVLSGALIEVILIAAWALFVGRGQFDFDPYQLPVGSEVPMVTQYHFIWTLLFKCGDCVLWNGFTNGGAPAFAELQGAVLHPLVILTTLIWGVINGGKVVLVVSLFMAGMGQWWLARVLGLGRLARLWGAALIVVGGHLAGRMENGGLLLVLSTASGSLAIAPMVELALTRKKSALVWSGITLALVFLSGQGYIQIGLLGAVLPALAIFYLRGVHDQQPLWKDFLLAVGLAVLLVGVFWVPLLHFWQNFIKDSDPYLSQLQPLQYIPLNFVVKDMEFFKTKLLGRDLASYIYINFIGWLPVVLAVLSLRLVPREKNRLLIFFGLSIGFLFLISSKDFMQLLMQFIPEVKYIRNAPVIAGLAMPMIVALAAWSVDLLMRLDWPKLGYFNPEGKGWQIPLSYLLVTIPLLLSIIPVYSFNQNFMGLIQGKPPTEAANALVTEDSQWIGIPYGEYLMVPEVLGRGMKIAHLYRPWSWKGRDFPVPFREVSRLDEARQAPGYVGDVDEMALVNYPENLYASLSTNDGVIPCTAQSTGGYIDVQCSANQDGLLTVMENSFSGWVVRMDGRFMPLVAGNWLRVAVPAGEHTFQFRYRPWDVPVGVLVSLLGVGLAVWILRRK
jgi:hypothetical protein